MIHSMAIGRLTKDPILSYDDKNQAKAELWLACPDPSGGDTSFLHVVTYGRKAETAHNYLSKGREVTAIGNIKITWKRESNSTYVTLYADKIVFHADGREGRRGQEVPGSESGVPLTPHADDEEIPF